MNKKATLLSSYLNGADHKLPFMAGDLSSGLFIVPQILDGTAGTPAIVLSRSGSY